jgi:hypothetical protein
MYEAWNNNETKNNPELLGGKSPSQIRVWSLICDEKPIVLFENTAM